MRARTLFVAAAMFVSAGEVRAQEGLVCPGTDANARSCNSVIDAMLTTLAHTGLVTTAGNPLPGTSSTLGMRLGTLPRLSLAARFTGVESDIGSIVTSSGATSEISRNQSVLALDGAVGIFSGLSLFPTVGGVGSIDLLFGAGTVLTPDRNGIEMDGQTTWSIGARLGILQESFTAPGVSVTGKYVRVPGSTFAAGPRGNPNFDVNSRFDLSGNSIWSGRAVVGKRLFMFGALAGVGYDRYGSEASYGYIHREGTSTSAIGRDLDDISTSRTMVFGNLQFTLLVLSFIAEGGWQKGGDFNGALPQGQTATSTQNATFLSFALRLTI